MLDWVVFVKRFNRRQPCPQNKKKTQFGCERGEADLRAFSLSLLTFSILRVTYRIPQITDAQYYIPSWCGHLPLRYFLKAFQSIFKQSWAELGAYGTLHFL